MEKHKPNMPVHLLGSMWGQSWTNLYEHVKPFNIDDNLGKITEVMQGKSYSPRQMFDEADKFFLSMKLLIGNMSYDESKAAIVDIPNQKFACQPTAWDFYKDNDFRIKMCTRINMADFETIHQQMGHIQYYMNYANLPLKLRAGANPAFHEAIGDTIGLSFANPIHLYRVHHI